MNAVINKEKKENKSETVRRTKEMTKKFVRYKEGANLYSKQGGQRPFHLAGYAHAAF